MIIIKLYNVIKIIVVWVEHCYEKLKTEATETLASLDLEQSALSYPPNIPASRTLMQD